MLFRSEQQAFEGAGRRDRQRREAQPEGGGDDDALAPQDVRQRSGDRGDQRHRKGGNGDRQTDRRLARVELPGQGRQQRLGGVELEKRSEERRGGKGGVSTCRSRWSPLQ